MSKVSIITTTYKHQDFIAQTIESVLAQTYTNRELFIGDDSPDDATWHIIQDYVKKYPDKIKARYHTPNKGIVENMNFLIQQSSQDAEYISFLEGDDMYTPDNLECKMNVFLSKKNIDFIYTSKDIIDEKSKITTKNGILSYIKNFSRNMYEGEIKINLEKLLKIGNPIQSFGSVIIKKEVANKYFPVDISKKFGTTMFGPLDYYMWIQIIPNHKVYFIDKPLFLYRIHENNFVKNKSIMFGQFEMIYEDIKLNHIHNNDIIKVCNYFISGLKMMDALLQDDMSIAKKYRKQGFLYNHFDGLILRLCIGIGLYGPESLRRMMMKVYMNI